MGDRLRFTLLGCGSSPGVPAPDRRLGQLRPGEPEEPAHALRGACGTDFRKRRQDHGGDRYRAGFPCPDAARFRAAYRCRDLYPSACRSYSRYRRLAQLCAGPAPPHRHSCRQIYLARLHEAFGYCFETPPGSSYPPILKAHAIRACRPVTIDGEGGPLTFEPLPQVHGDIISLGFRIGDLAYCPDVSDFPQATVERLAGLKVLVIDALQYRTHPSHFSLAEALDWVERLAPEKAILTHMHVPLDYAAVTAETPTHVEPGYDGMAIEIPL